MEWVAANWFWIAPIGVPFVFGVLRYLVKKTKPKWDDKLVNEISKLWGYVPKPNIFKKSK